MTDLISSATEDIYKTAHLANQYARELRQELSPLIRRLYVNYPTEAARYAGLINELVLMTGITVGGIKNQT